MNNQSIKQPTKHHHIHTPHKPSSPEPINFAYKPTALCSSDKHVHYKFTYNDQPLKAFGEQLAEKHNKIIHTTVVYYDSDNDKIRHFLHKHTPQHLSPNTETLILEVIPTNKSFNNEVLGRCGVSMHICIYKKNRCIKCSALKRTDKTHHRKLNKKKSIMYFENTHSNQNYRRRQHNLPHLDQYNNVNTQYQKPPRIKQYYATSDVTSISNINYKRN